MTRNKLSINRLVIHTSDRKIAYDELYHKGVNIIRGDNSSGKSTITHFIFYVLGGAFNDWVKEAKKCSAVVAEVEMNAATFVVRREINVSETTHKANAIEPIHIFWGSYIESEKASISDWQKFSYNTTDDKKSFSNVFFENLDLPIVKGDNNITFHQILRLLYVDQDSPTSSLFLYEQFDTTLTRETVSDLLLGVYNQELYDNKQRLIDATNELDNIRKEIKVIKQFVPNELDLFPEHIKTKIDNKEKEIAAIEDELIKLKEQGKQVKYLKTTKLDFEKIQEEAIKQREIVNNLGEKISTLKYEIEDSTYFIKTLENKIRAIKNSILTREFLGDFPLEYCPECLTELKKVEGNTSCKLCKEPIDNTFGVTQGRRIEQELMFQIKESNSLLAKRKRELVEEESRYESEKIKHFTLQSRVNAALKDVKSVRDEKIDSLYVEKGFCEGEILQLRTLLESSELYQALIKSRFDLEQELIRLHANIDQMTSYQISMKQKINSAIEKEALYLLNNDLKRQDDFIAAREFNIDYRNNLAFIADKEAKYSASSNFYLKTTARFAIFLASLSIDEMRYPRFILCDNMEDKGIEERRAQNFQKIIIDEAEKHDDNSYQIIYTTSLISEELKNSKYCVGEYYTKESPSLKNISL
jgi:hypothetical protein